MNVQSGIASWSMYRVAIVRAGVCMLALAAATGWWWKATRDEIKTIASERYASRADEAREAVRQRLGAYEQVVRGAAAFVTVRDGLTRADWKTYVDQLNLAQHYPGIQALALSRVVQPSDFDSFTASMRERGFPEYAIQPLGQRALYVPVALIEPFNWRNRRALGFDLLTEPVRRAALWQAAESAAAAATGKITLKQETSRDTQSGFLVCAAVFPHGQAPATLAERRNDAAGFVCAVFRMNDLMDGIFGDRGLPYVRMAIYDQGDMEPSSLMYDSATGEHRENGAWVRTDRLDFGGRQWMLRMSSTPAFDDTMDRQKPFLVLACGLLVSLLFACVIWVATLNGQRERQIAANNADLRRLASDLEQARSIAEAASQAKSDFLANVSHELRTPLTLILAPLEQLRRAASAPPDWQQQIGRITRNGLLLLNRVNDILDFSKADAGKLQVHWEEVDLLQRIAPLLDDAAAAAANKRLQLAWTVSPQLGRVVVDARHLETILLNLVSNAIKFTPPGGRIDIAIEALDGGRFELAVSDTGIGLAPDQQGALFRRFEQADSSITRQFGGTGIGLALVKQLATLMEGEVGLSSALGQGSRFFVHLPCRHPIGDQAQSSKGTNLPIQTVPLRERLIEHDAIEMPNCRRETERSGILVADDNPDMCAYLAQLLGSVYNVTVAHDGAQAWQLLQQYAFELVLSDVMMPGLDGFALVAKIKNDEALAHIPVILLTARGGEQASTSGLASGADDYIAKPFSPDELLARVNAALRMADLQARQRRLSREAGMAMIASGVLHNMGNLLCNFRVSVDRLCAGLRQSACVHLPDAAAMLRREGGEAFVALADYLERLAQRVDAEHARLGGEGAALRHCIDHMSNIVASHAQFDHPQLAVPEVTALADIIEPALALSQSRLQQLGVKIDTDIELLAAARVDRYQVMQILLNLLANATDALASVAPGERCLHIEAGGEAGRQRIRVRDTGAGIAPDVLPRVFQQGFSTKGHGHGYGLHMCAIWARQSGCTLTADSAGIGQGACFELELPRPHEGGDDACKQALSTHGETA